MIGKMTLQELNRRVDILVRAKVAAAASDGDCVFRPALVGMADSAQRAYEEAIEQAHQAYDAPIDEEAERPLFEQSIRERHAISRFGRHEEGDLKGMYYYVPMEDWWQGWLAAVRSVRARSR